MKKVPGQLLIELLLAMAIFALMVPAIIAGLVTANQSDTLNQRRLEATAIAREMNEALRVIREGAWTNVAAPGTYHVEIAGTTWSLAPAAQTLDGFTRSLAISDVSRDAAGLIVATGGTNDPSTRKVVITVSWNEPFINEVRQEFYLTRFLDNIVQVDTTVSNFNQGILEGTSITDNNGGEITLGAGGFGSWCDPNLTIQAVDLPKSGVANAISAIPGKIIAGTGENASGEALATVTVQNTDPPQTAIEGTFNGYKTNGVFTEEQYGYLATDTNAKEVVIIDMDQQDVNGKYSEVGYFDATGVDDGMSVATAGNIGFVVTGSKIFSFNLSSKSGSRALLASLALPGPGTKLDVVGSELYISLANTGTAKKLQVVRFDSVTGALSNFGYASFNSERAQDVSVNTLGNRAYIVTQQSATQPEFFIINVAGKSSSNPNLSIEGSYNDISGMSPKAVSVVPGNKAIIVGSGGEEYQTINIATESAPVRCGGLQLNSGINGIATVVEADNDAYSYIITADATSELKIIEGGPGGQLTDAGVFTSRIIDVGYSSVFNYFDWIVNIISNTTIQYQIAIADAVNATCADANYVFVGPDLSSSTYFSGPAAIPFNDDNAGYENPGQCFRYKLFLSSTDAFSIPDFLEMSVNYNP